MTTNNDIVRDIVSWWRSLQPREHEGRRLKGDRAAIAQLRRAGSILELCVEPATIALCRKVPCRPEAMAGYALIAGVLASVRTDGPQSLARLLGEPEGSPRCSPLRFRKLIEAVELDEQLIAFRRAVAQVGHQANVRDLAATLLDWNEPSRADQRKQRWLYEYYHVAQSQDFSSAKENVA